MPTDRFPAALVSDSRGRIFDLPGAAALAQNGSSTRPPETEEITPLPRGSHLYLLPGRSALALKNGRAAKIEGTPVAAVLPQGYTRTLLPAYEHPPGTPWLPFFGYTACFFQNGKIYAAALPTQADSKWNPESFDPGKLKKKIKAKLARNPDNRTLRQIAFCAGEYRCYTAANVFFERWEGALPVSPSCNSACRGCLSKAEDPGPESPQERFNFVPSLEECVEIVRAHFEKAPEPIISFGQGCEGEPSLQAELIEKIIRSHRADFPRGQFNMNTNGSRPREMEKFCRAGLNSIRVSLNSAREKWYDAYYRPKNYRFQDLRETIRIAKAHGVFVSLNLLCFPGVTDHPRETESFFKFLRDVNPDMIQLRNLNIDPRRYLVECIREEVSGTGMSRWMKQVQEEFPEILIGSFTPYVL